MLNGYLCLYVCLYGMKSVEVWTVGSYAAQVEAARLLNVPKNKRYMIAVFLAEKDGQDVVHTADF